MFLHSCLRGWPASVAMPAVVGRSLSSARQGGRRHQCLRRGAGDGLASLLEGKLELAQRAVEPLPLEVTASGLTGMEAALSLVHPVGFLPPALLTELPVDVARSLDAASL